MKEPGWVGKGINGGKWSTCLDFSSGVGVPQPTPPDRSEDKPVLYVVKGDKIIALARHRSVGFVRREAP